MPRTALLPLLHRSLCHDGDHDAGPLRRCTLLHDSNTGSLLSAILEIEGMTGPGPFELDISPGLYDERASGITISKETLNLYRHQREAVEACVGASRGMIKMFCGTGKTRVMLGVIAAAEQVSVTLVVFPRIVLLEQFRADYISKSDWMPLVSTFFVSSEDESIEAAMLAVTSAGTKRVVVCVTYASLGKLVDTMCATGQLPGLLVFDEAHHCVADRVFEVITEQLAGTRILYFTATPVPQMLDAVDTFGEVLFEYSYADGVADGVLKPFDVVVEIGAEDAPGGLYSQIVSTALATGNSHALVFYSYAEADATESRSSVKDYTGDVARGRYQKMSI